MLLDDSHFHLKKFVDIARNIGLKIPFSLLNIDKKNIKGKIRTTDYILISPYDSNISIVNEYIKAVKEFDTKTSTSFAGLYGYIVANSALYITAKIDGEINAQNFAVSARKIKAFSLDGLDISLINNTIDKNFLNIAHKEYVNGKN